MSILSTLLAPWRERKNSTLELFRELYGSALSKSGAAVTWETALRVSTCFACLRVLSEGVAQVPLKLFTGTDTERRPAREHPLYSLLHSMPNEWQTSFEWRETAMLHTGLTGNHYSFINRRPGGVVAELIPFVPGQVTPKRDATGVRTYVVTLEEGRQQTLPASDVFHLRGPSWSGWFGLETVRLAREAVGLAATIEEQSARQFGSQFSAPGVYTVEGKLSPEQYKDLRKFLVDNHTGANAGVPMVLDRGAKWTSMAMTSVDAEQIAQRRMQIEEICRFFRVMPIMVGFADKTATYASSEQMFLAHVVHTLTPWYARFEQAIGAQLLTAQDRAAGIYPRFIAQGLLRGSMNDRAAYFSKALGAGGSPAWMTQDEVRALEELNPLGGAASALPVATNVPRSASSGDKE